MQALTSQADSGEHRVHARPGIFSDWAASCPPIKGAEYLDEDVFANLWTDLEAAFWRACSRRPVREFLADEFPAWADAGRVYLHIAENKTNDERPFTVLMTYGVRDADKPRLQHRPIGLALADAGRASDAKLVEGLLRLIARAAKASSEFSRLHAERLFYRPFNLSPTAAFRLINEFPLIERAGIPCKVPEYWEKGRPQQAQVAVTFKTGPRKPSHLTQSMLAFDVGLTLGNEKLTDEEIEALLAAREPFVSLKGRWVEVNPERVGRLLDRWRTAQQMAGESGMSFGEALRWTGGLSTGEGEAEAASGDEPRQPLVFKTDSELSELLRSLRNPDLLNGEAAATVLKRCVRADLRPYQLRGVSWLHQIAQLGMGGCLADDMGLGKTLQVVCLITIDKELARPKAPSLLIVPASLIGNWLGEIAKFSPTLRPLVIHSSAGWKSGSEVPKAQLSQADVVITTYGMITRPSWMNDIRWHFVIADEAQALKNPGTRQSQAVRALSASARFALTGTPVENNLTDLWSIFDFAVPGLLGSKQAFAAFVKHAVSGSQDLARLRAVINPWLLRRKKTDKNVISDLPDKTELRTDCFLTVQQAVLYKKQVEQAAIAIANADGIARKGLIFSTMMKLKQICNHPSQREGDGVYDRDHSGKFRRLIELCCQIAERQEKVLVFTQFRELTDIIAHELELVFKRSGLVLHGAVPVDKRRQLVESFQNEDGPPFFVLSVKAGGTGLNLTAASHVIHFDRWWNPAVENQATDRAFRIGQKRNVLVHKFVCKGTIEESIDELIESKKILADGVVEGGGEINLSTLSDEELMNLMKLRGDPLQADD